MSRIRWIVNGRRMGKTSTLLNLMRSDNRMIMVCITYQEADRLRQENPDIEPRRFVSSQAVKDGVLRGSAPGTRLVVDNLDIMLPNLLGTHHPIAAVTVEGEH